MTIYSITETSETIYKCVVCNRRHNNFHNANLCCLKVVTPETIRARADTKCRECKRVIPKGWTVKEHLRGVQCLGHFEGELR